MKKIFVLLSMGFMLSNITSVSKLGAIEELPIYTGELVNIEYRVVEDHSGYIVIEINGKKYQIKVQ